MSTVYFLLPGLRIPGGDFCRVLDKTDRDALSAIIGEGRGAVAGRLASGLTLPFSLCAHHLWFWSVVNRGKTTPAHAAYEWLENNGPTLSTEIWSVTPCRRDGYVLRSLGDDPLDAAEADECSGPLRRALAKHGFVLQIWDDAWYATRMKDWNAVLRPWVCQDGRGLDEAAAAGDRETAFHAMRDCGETLSSCEPVQRRRAAGRPAPDAVWISGGGRQIRFYPPTKIRSVLSDEPVLRAWAKESGILCQYVAAASSGAWPADAPPGDVIAVVGDLWAPWLRGDWDAWIQALPHAASRVASLRSLARERGSADSVTVAFGNGTSATFGLESPGLGRRLLRRFARKPSGDSSFAALAEEWTGGEGQSR